MPLRALFLVSTRFLGCLGGNWIQICVSVVTNSTHSFKMGQKVVMVLVPTSGVRDHLFFTDSP